MSAHRNETPRGLARRGFLQASTGLFVGFSLFGAGVAAAAENMPGVLPIGGVKPPPDAGKLYAWLAVHPDNTATLFTGKVEVGTGTETALAQIAAEELDFPIDRLGVVMGTTSETVNQGPTYGSRTIRYAGPQIRNAAAAGRAALLNLAAEHFKTGADHLDAKDGVITVRGAAQNSITYGELVAGKRLDVEIGASGKSFAMKVAPKAKLKNAADYKVVGTSVHRKDIPAKSSPPTPTSRTSRSRARCMAGSCGLMA